MTPPTARLGDPPPRMRTRCPADMVSEDPSSTNRDWTIADERRHAFRLAIRIERYGERYPDAFAGVYTSEEGLLFYANALFSRDLGRHRAALCRLHPSHRVYFIAAEYSLQTLEALAQGIWSDMDEFDDSLPVNTAFVEIARNRVYVGVDELNSSVMDELARRYPVEMLFVEEARFEQQRGPIPGELIED